jgi:molecular chaperone DnaK
VIPVDGDGIVPSVVSFDDDKILVGRKALNRAIVFPELSVRSVKRRMGSDEMIAIAGQQPFSPEKISSIILRYLCDEAMRVGGHDVKKVVITVPAYFSDSQRRATVAAGEMAGLEVVRIINEPTAAGLFYDLVELPEEKKKNQAAKWTYSLVYDLGGGTFDVSILKFSEIIEVVASTGDTRLGGDDFDAAITEFLLEEIKKQNKGLDLSDYRPAVARLTAAAEQAKKDLSQKGFVIIQEALIPVPKGNNPVNLECELTRTNLEEMTKDLVKRTMEFVQNALKEASLKYSDIDRVVMVGGMTRMPLITLELSRLFGDAQLPAVDPDLSVAHGAAIQGSIITGDTLDSILVDVTSHTLSIVALNEDHNLHCVPIIPRNTAIPATRQRVFYTMIGGQEKVELDVYQGESSLLAENTLIGKKYLKLASSPAQTPVEIEFSYDLNGIVHVIAEQRGYGRKVELKIDSRNPKQFTDDIIGRSEFFDGDDDDYDENDDDDDNEGLDAQSGLSESKGINYVVRRVKTALEKMESGPEKTNLSELLVRYQKALATDDNDIEIENLEDELMEKIENLNS